MGLVVQKFGGTSVADAERIHRAARRAIRAQLDGNRVVMVISAMAKPPTGSSPWPIKSPKTRPNASWMCS